MPRQVLATLAGLDEARLKTYTVFVLNAASESARRALEALMATTQFRNAFVDRLLAEGEAKGRAEGEAKGRAEGEAKGEAQIILRVLSARGMQVPAEIRRRVLSCADTRQLETWADRAVTADSIDDVFGS
jgi:predicted transposase YdaD